MDSLTKKGETPLGMAVEHNALQTVKDLLAAGAKADLHQRGEKIDVLGTPSNVSKAAYLGHVDVMMVLLQRGGKPLGCNSTGDFDATPLHFATAREGPDDNGESVRALIQAGAPLEAVLTASADKLTPLHVAASREVASCGTIRALLEEGANVHAISASGKTPLHMACARSSVDAVGLLLRWWADERLIMDEDGDVLDQLVGIFEVEDDDHYYSFADFVALQAQRIDDNALISHMLASAPADRRWRRRGWLILARCCPTSVQLASDGDAENKAKGGVRRGQGDSTAKIMRTESWPEWGGGGMIPSGNGGADEVMADLVSLVNRLVGLETECVFRMVVGFL